MAKTAGAREHRHDGGFTLVEILVATALLGLVAVGIAGVCAAALASVSASREGTTAAVLAAQRLEQLRGLTFGFDEAGAPRTDVSTDLSTEPASNGGNGLRASPIDALTANRSGYVDYLDGRGGWVGAGVTPPAAAVFVRRWRVTPLPGSEDDVLVLQVLVATRAGDLRRTAQEGPRGARLNEVVLTTMKARKGRGA